MTEPASRLDVTCPICGSSQTQPFLERAPVPVHQNLLLPTRQAAKELPAGRLAMHVCQGCGFGYNAAFDSELVTYNQDYDNTQGLSPSFADHLNGLVQELVERRDVRGCRVIEVGCGKGTFLAKVVSYPGASNTGHGFDPSYVGPEELLDGQLRFSKSLYGPETKVPADVVICRHVIEHVAQPLQLLQAIRAALVESPQARVFLETPCLEWILVNRVGWDFFFEHCSLFTADSLQLAVERSGFHEVRCSTVFGGQYLWLEARVGPDSPTVTTIAPPRTPELAIAFAGAESLQISQWQARIAEMSSGGSVAVWGAGAKGVTFCNLVDPECQRIACVIDINPAKHGKHLAGTGHMIVGPGNPRMRTASAIIVLNPNYHAEIERHVRRQGSSAPVIDLMAA